MKETALTAKQAAIHIIIPASAFILSVTLYHASHGMSLFPGDAVSDDCDFHEVSRVIDGDTFIIADGNKVRLIGVDTPETVDPRMDVQWFGRESSATLREWIGGDTVCLRRDRDRTADRDRYGRLLRYVWKYANRNDAHDPGKGFFVNAELIRQGYAFAYTRFPFQYLEEFKAHEKHAREKSLGLWSREKLEAWQNVVRKNSSLALTCGDAETVCPDDAILHAGKKKTVRFFVKKSFDSGKAIFLNSANDHTVPHNFTAVIFDKSRRNFPDNPADHYWGKTVEVTGVIQKYKGRAEIILKDNTHIRVLE